MSAMKTKTHILKTADGKKVHTAYQWDSERNREYNKTRLEKIHGPLKWEDGPDAETISV